MLDILATALLLDELARGPLVQVENGAGGRFECATAIAVIDAPIERVWSTVSDFARYVEFAPKVVASKPRAVSANVLEVEVELDNPGPNTRYVVRHELDPAGHRIASRQVSGDLAGSRWSWTMEPVDAGRTLVRYRGSVRNFSALAERLEDEQQTITVGINVSAVIALVRAVEARAEAR